ncbi:MAG: DNA polymerase III subunit beta [Deltaproteobacteria bacterium]|nr:DNA polymerase III subunit beta [Deltaproteobacteria bacterium]MBI4796339.1 DNA polymerase III subunit beta [Deltaproteobacteria bacterium]
MRLTMERETLLKGVSRTLGVVDRRGTMPILSHFLLEAGDGGVKISATDLEVSFQGSYPAMVEEPGSLTLPAHYFHNLIKELPGESLNLEGTEKSNLQLTVGESRYQLLGLPADQYPAIPEITDQKLVEVESRVLREMIEKTIFSVSVDDLQYHLSGIFWERVEVEGAFQLRMVSTDGHRLTLIERPLPESEQFAIEEGILIPRKGVGEISRLLAEEEKVSLGLSRQSLALKADSKFLFIRLLEKKFPEYRRIIPEASAFHFVLNRRDLRDTLHRISLLSTERFRGVILKMGAEQLEASFSNPEVGEGREVLPLTLEKGSPGDLPLEIGFNARYILEPLNVMDANEVVLEINDRDRPCRLVSKGDPGYFTIIMPMSL